MSSSTSTGSSWTPNTSIRQGDGNKEDNLYDTIVIGASLTAIIIVLVLLRFVINIVIDIVILRDVDAARTKCNNLSSRCYSCLSRYCCYCCCGYCCHRHRIQPVVPSQDTNHTATDVHSDVDDLEAHDMDTDEDDDESSYSSHDSNTPTLELSFSLTHHQHHHYHHSHHEDPTGSSADTKTHADLTPPTDPEIMLLQSMDTLLPSKIVTNEWIVSIMSHLIHPTTNRTMTNIATTKTTAAIPDDENDVTTGWLESGLAVVSLSETEEHDVVREQQQRSVLVPMNENNKNDQLLPFPYSSDVEDTVSTLPTCSICLQECSVGQTISTVETCQHYFHTTCLHEWILQPVVIQQPNQTHQRRRRRRRGLEQPSVPSPLHPLVPVRRVLLQSTRRNNHCPNCRTPIIVPESELEEVLHSVFTRQQQQQQQEQHRQEER